jgi:hypothetical protein
MTNEDKKRMTATASSILSKQIPEKAGPLYLTIKTAATRIGRNPIRTVCGKSLTSNTAAKSPKIVTIAK